MKCRYCDGVDLKICCINNKLEQLDGWFYERGDSWGPTYVNLLDEIKIVDEIRIQNPNIIKIHSYDYNIHVEYFTSVMIINNTLIIEV